MRFKSSVMVAFTSCFVCVGGCATYRDVERPVMISKQEAVELASKEAVENRKWAHFEIVNVTYNREGSWSVLVQRIPVVPCGHAVIEISAQSGEVIRYYE